MRADPEVKRKIKGPDRILEHGGRLIKGLVVGEWDNQTNQIRDGTLKP